MIDLIAMLNSPYFIFSEFSIYAEVHKKAKENKVTIVFNCDGICNFVGDIIGTTGEDGVVFNLAMHSFHQLQKTSGLSKIMPTWEKDSIEVHLIGRNSLEAIRNVPLAKGTFLYHGMKTSWFLIDTVSRPNQPKH